MKLLECHIENYGNISKRDFNFNNELNEFCEENGYGKTTLASFIKAMFYGLPSYRTTTKDFPDRMHYYPFNGGKFGGSLTFEMSGAEYRIERFFGKKSDKDDVLTVYCNNKKDPDFGDDIGKVVFGLDQESFERTVFINSDAIDICATGGISAKLNNFVADLDGSNSIESVINAIKKPQKELKADRGNSGLIETTREKIRDITNSIKNTESIEQTLEQSYAERRRLQEEIRLQKDEIEEIKNRNTMIERWEQYEERRARKADLVNSQKNVEAKFPQGIPSESEIVSMKENNQKIVLLSGKRTAVVFDATKQKRLDELSAVFADGVPSDEYMQELKSSIDEIRNDAAQIKALSGQEQSTRFVEQKRKFGNALPNEQKISEIESRVEQYRVLDNMQKVKVNIAADGNESAHSRPRMLAIFAAMFALIAIGGIGMLFVNMIVGGVVSGVGAVGLLAIGFLYLRNLGLNRQTVVVDDSTVKQQAEMRQIEAEVREYLVKYGYYSPNGIVFDFGMFKNDYKDYIQNLDKANNNDKELQTRRVQLSKNTAEVKTVFAKYGIDNDDFQDSYMSLQSMIGAFTAMRMDSESCNTRQADIANDINEYMSEIKAVMSKYGICPADDVAKQLDDFEMARKEYARLKGDIAKVEDEINEYKSKYALTEKPTEVAVDITDLNKKLENSRNELAMLESGIASDESVVECLGDKRNQLADVE